MKRSLTATLLITAVSSSALLSAGLAFADSLIATRCKDEAEKLCAGIAPGGGRLAKCLRGHDAELSDPCKAALAAGWQGTKAGAATAAPAEPAPKAEAAAPATPPKAPPAAAPKAPSAAAATAPAAALAAAPAAPAAAPAAPAAPLPGETGAMLGMRRTCADEIEKLCKEVQPGQGRIAFCLNEHGKELSSPCKKATNLVMRQLNASMETHQACAADVEKLCPDVQPGAGRIAFCLGEHAAELSAPCQQQIAELKAAKRAPAAPVPPQK